MTRLYTGEHPVKGMTAGPGSDPSRSGSTVVLKILRDGSFHEETPYEGTVTRLRRIVGYEDVQSSGMPLVPSAHSGQQHRIRILDYFALPWPGGSELPEEGDPADHCVDGVVVLEQAGTSLAAWQRAQADPFVSLPIARQIVRQVLLALDYLHDGLPGYGIGHCVSIPGVQPLPPLEERIEAQGRIQDPVEVKQLASFLKACWVLDPFHRPKAKQLLEHEWLRGVE
ncbi:hypothetical protein JCM11641_000779 [Rhodosporidiobolus odoratus]